MHKRTHHRVFTGVWGLLFATLVVSSVNAQATDPYMGASVTLGKAPNGAIANQKLLDGIEKVGWLKPTIEEPVEGIWVFGGYGLAPVARLISSLAEQAGIADGANTPLLNPDVIYIVY